MKFANNVVTLSDFFFAIHVTTDIRERKLNLINVLSRMTSTGNCTKKSRSQNYIKAIIINSFVFIALADFVDCYTDSRQYKNSRSISICLAIDIFYIYDETAAKKLYVSKQHA